jgi:hypothetical protein
MIQVPFDIKNIGDGLQTSSISFLTVIEISILFHFKEELFEVCSKLPRKFTEKEFEKYNLKSLISRTRIVFTLPGVWGILAIYYFTLKTFAMGERKFPIDLIFPFDISHPIVFNGILLDMLLFLTIYEIYIVISQVLKYGLITVTAVEFMKLRDEFKKLRKEVKKYLKFFIIFSKF